MDRKQQKAMSLAELLIALALLGTLFGLAIPGFGKLLQDNRDEALRNLLHSQIQQTRAQAVINNQQYRLCGSSDGITCNGDWQKHWLITTTSPPQLHHLQQLPANNGLCWRGLGKDIRFQPNGTTYANNGRFTLCRDGKTVWALTINRQGRVRDSSAEMRPGCCSTSHTDT
ncbi:GspH/FimT family protein [Pseudomonas chengduensis]|uniref:GspH/FimT family protein n=1 Tax=Ectopseudomonas oleovorans TaxID=301 RepID=UPI002448EB5A|nr:MULTISPECIES: GspH/FimT family protein [Pseudomonas]MDG9978409.1 GspH/FimT family protein [Pseudomonas oleovorans]MDH0625851.1 GspH/FimT family protein [Pseudomonas chengduensis]MDH1664951.1 GspH/FimT family protein [Pseudomonas chengduensis]MDH2200339.1 GspH/FimT family protein [Pseudomonas oleovorans]